MATETTIPSFTTPCGRDSSAREPGAEPSIDLDTMLDLTAAAEVNGVKFDGVDLFLFDPHVDIDASDDELKRLADKVASEGLRDRLGRRAGLAADRRRLRDGRGGGPQEVRRQVRKACRIAENACASSASARTAWSASTRPRPRRLGEGPGGQHQRSSQTFREACDVAEDHGERLAAEGEICWGGMHCWKTMVATARGGRTAPASLGSRPTWPTRCSTRSATTRPRTALLPEDFDWEDPAVLDAALTKLTDALRPWTIDFHVAQNDAHRQGLGLRTTRPAATAWRTTRTASSTSPAHAGFWLRDDAAS